MNRHRHIWRLTLLFCLSVLLLCGAARAAPRYYIVLRNIEVQGMSSADPTVALARKMFAEELARRGEVVSSAADLAALSALAGDEAAMKAELSRRKLKGYQFTVRLLSASRDILPPPRGKQFRVLSRGVKLTVLGTTLPGEWLAVGGDGESTVQAEVGAQISPSVEQAVLGDAMRDALSQAISQAIRKLDRGGIVPPPERRRK